MSVVNRRLVLFPCADQWSVQETIKRIVASLAKRKYTVWFDLINMKEDIVDSMAEAVDGADLVLVGVSRLYKESANCSTFKRAPCPVGVWW